MSAAPASLSSPFGSVRLAGWQLALRILIGAGTVWVLVHHFGHRDPLWAMISVVIVSEPELDATLLNFRGRALHTVIGCAVGLAFLYTFGPQNWSILLAMAVSVLIVTNLVSQVVAWRITPVTVAIVMMPSVIQGSRIAGTPIALVRTLEVLLGSAVAVGVSWIFAEINRARRKAKAWANSR